MQIFSFVFSFKIFSSLILLLVDDLDNVVGLLDLVSPVNTPVINTLCIYDKVGNNEKKLFCIFPLFKKILDSHFSFPDFFIFYCVPVMIWFYLPSLGSNLFLSA